MRLLQLHIKTKFKNLDIYQPFLFSEKDGISVIIGNNNSGKSNLLEAISSVFCGLYDSKHKTGFSYQLIYKKNNQMVKVEFEFTNSRFTYHLGENNTKTLDNELLPSMVVSAYSGEEPRLWDEYYYSFYKSYITKIITSKGNVSENMRMVFLNKYHWNIAYYVCF